MREPLVKQNFGSAHRESVKTDAQLIREARSDPDAFAELYRRHASAIAKWFSVRVPQRIAGELTAETFAQAALSLRRFRDEADGSAAPWLFGIARNLLRRSLERERVADAARKRLGVPLHSYSDDEDELVERMDAAQLRPSLEAALQRLPDTQREAVQLRVIRALDYDEIAASVGCSQVAARIRVTRGLNSLSRLMKGVTP
jgi:RNA polymerase sigma-70 factor (ECF subfamily)